MKYSITSTITKQSTHKLRHEVIKRSSIFTQRNSALETMAALSLATHKTRHYRMKYSPIDPLIDQRPHYAVYRIVANETDSFDISQSRRHRRLQCVGS